MTRKERVRELVSAVPGPDYIREKAQAGWKLRAVEWERELLTDAREPAARMEVPYGLRVADDCMHLEEDLVEREVLTVIMNMIADDRPLTEVVKVLNAKGSVTRHGAPWTPPAVFKLLPRLIDAGPRVFATSEWAQMREGRLRQV